MHMLHYHKLLKVKIGIYLVLKLLKLNDNRITIEIIEGIWRVKGDGRCLVVEDN